MAKLTKKQRSEIEYTITRIKDALKFINRPDIIVAHNQPINIKCPQCSSDYRGKVETTKHYSRIDENGIDKGYDITYVDNLEAINKEFGSDLIHLYTAIQTLENFLD